MLVLPFDRVADRKIAGEVNERMSPRDQFASNLIVPAGLGIVARLRAGDMR